MLRPLFQRCGKHTTNICARHSSKLSSKQDWPTNVDIPPDRMRALISMYHQSESFITKATLGGRIDDAFTKPRAVTDDAVTWKDMTEFLERQAKEPKYTDTMEGGGTDSNPSWTTKQSKRHQLVGEALYGIETSHSTPRTYPGLDVLLENDPNEDFPSLEEPESVGKSPPKNGQKSKPKKGSKARPFIPGKKR